eukprot:15941579-Heterocapsa_arctica.AAC.1
MGNVPGCTSSPCILPLGDRNGFVRQGKRPSGKDFEAASRRNFGKRPALKMRSRSVLLIPNLPVTSR